MPWQDRIKEAAYRSPSGVRIVFQYEAVSREVDKKTTAYTFPDAQGTYVQDLGRSGRRYPLRIFFWGENHDLQANVFEVALLEPGEGVLEHPLYGQVNVVPFGKIKQRDDLKREANQSVFEVSFWETIGLVYPTLQVDPVSDIQTALQAYNEAMAEQFFDNTNLSGAVAQNTFLSGYRQLLDTVKETVGAVADFQENVQRQFNAIHDSINAGIDTLISDPLTLAFQTTLLIQAPARALGSIQARLSAYRDLAQSITSGEGAVVTPSHTRQSRNTYHTRDLFVSTAVTGSVLAAVNHQFDSKPEALTAAESILQQLDEVTTWQDQNTASLSEVDQGITYQQLQKAVALTAGFLVQISFTLKQERHLILTRARTPLDVCAQLYGNVDETMNFFIDSNHLSGDEYFELPAGRDVVYYV